MLLVTQYPINGTVNVASHVTWPHKKISCRVVAETQCIDF